MWIVKLNRPQPQLTHDIGFVIAEMEPSGDALLNIAFLQSRFIPKNKSISSSIKKKILETYLFTARWDKSILISGFD